jgi:transcriptional regulator with XRE-family HTH domain
MMLQQLIRRALKRNQLSMRQASLAAGMNEGWLKQFMASRGTYDPGISAMLALAEVLEIDHAELIAAVAQDSRGSPRDRHSLDAAIKAITEMTPQERAAFLAAHRTRRP